MWWYGRALLVLVAGGMAPQARDRDAGTFIVSVNGTVVGREEFSIRNGRAASRDGFTVTSRRLSADGGAVTLLATTELGADSLPVSAQLAEPGVERRTLIQVSPRRITVRTVTPAGESVREYRGGAPVLLADHEALAWFAMAPRLGGGAVTVLWPRGDRREIWEIEDRGVGTDSLRHMVLGTAPGEHHLWYDDAGRLRKVENPATGLQAVRAVH